jgi:hypothetical protein
MTEKKEARTRQYPIYKFAFIPTLKESLSITTGRCDLAIATHPRKMHKNLFVVVHLEVLDND